MTEIAYHDVLGIGFGPANIALAIGLEELWPDADVHFLDRSSSTAWQGGMLLPGADVQHYAMRDLVTPRNPRSKYSFLNFLHAKGRLYAHTNLGVPFPLRSEYAEYVQWVAEHFEDRLSTGTAVTGLSLVPGTDRPWIEAVTESGNVVRARALVLGPGRSPHIPEPFAGLRGPDVIHSTDYLGLRERLDESSRVAVIGGSQSAVEIVLDLHRRRTEVLAVTRTYGYRQKDTSPFDEEVFHPEFTDYFFDRTPEQRNALLQELKHTNYSAADADVLRDLYLALYEDRLRGTNTVTHCPGHLVADAERIDGGIRLTLRERYTGETSTHVVDAVVLATGFRDLGPGRHQEQLPPLLTGMSGALALDADGVVSVSRDYKVATAREDGPVVFLNGLCESSHGLGDAGSFGQVALRVEHIISGLQRELTAGRAAPARTNADQQECLAFIESNLTGSGMQALRLARRAGFRVVFLTSDLGAYTADPEGARAIAECVDEVVDCVTIDPDAVEQQLKELRRPVSGVMTVGEYYVAIATEVAARFGVAGLDPSAAVVARDKLRTREACAAAGIAVPEFGFASNAAEAEATLERTGLPCVVKPVDESASVGVSLCRTREEVLARVEELAGSQRNSRGQRHRPGGLIEQYLIGHEVSVETMTHAGRHRVLGVTDKQLGPLPSFVETGHTFPSALPTATTDAVARTALGALDAIGFDFGVAHTELKVTASGPVLVEINARTPGDRIPSLIEHATGVNILEQYVAMHTGRVPEVMPTQHGAAAIRFVTGEDGVIRSVHGLETARQIPGVVEVALRRGPGDHTHRPRNSHERLGHVIAVGDSPAEASARADAALQHIAVTYHSPEQEMP